MNNFEQAKVRLRDVLEKLEDTISTKYLSQNYLEKINKLEIENNDLRASLLMMKKETAELKQKLKSLTIKQEQQSLGTDTSNPLLDLNSIAPKKGSRLDVAESQNENTLSLVELKNVVGDN